MLWGALQHGQSGLYRHNRAEAEEFADETLSLRAAASHVLIENWFPKHTGSGSTKELKSLSDDDGAREAPPGAFEGDGEIIKPRQSSSALLKICTSEGASRDKL